MITANIEEGILEIPDLGVTLRSMLGCAVACHKENPRRTWKLRYKNVIVGSVRLKDNGGPIVKPAKKAQLSMVKPEQLSKDQTCQTQNQLPSTVG